MRVFLALALLLPFSACTSMEGERAARSLPAAVHTVVTFEPLDREQAARYLEGERHVYKTKTAPMVERQAGLSAGRAERYEEIRREFPECDRQRHCMQGVSFGSIKKFERFHELTREIHAYDQQLAELEVSIREWKDRFELRGRAILNRFMVHEVLQIPSVDNRFQDVLVYSLEHFETRRALLLKLMRYAGENVVPRTLGDYDFRMLGTPVDEAAVIATFEVNLKASGSAEDSGPTRYVVSLLVNTHQLDLRYYDKDFLRALAAKLAEPHQPKLRQDVYCSLYATAGETLAPRLEMLLPKQCASARALMQAKDPERYDNGLAPDRWLLPIAYYSLSQNGPGK